MIGLDNLESQGVQPNKIGFVISLTVNIFHNKWIDMEDFSNPNDPPV